jgi:dienelactone hydrolase
MTVHMGEKKFLGRTLLITAAFLGMLAFAGAPRASAESYDSCQHRIVKADHKLHQAVDHHGWNSKQADRARFELRQARERCWNERHRWWDEDGHRWHSDRDWDDHDHDRH